MSQMPTLPQTPAGGNKVSVQVWYTGKKIDGTVIASDVVVGAPVYAVPDASTGSKYGRPKDVTRAETAALMEFVGIVAEVPEGSKRGGPIWVWVGAGTICKALVKANAVNGNADPTLVTPLGGVDGSWKLQAVAQSVASAAANVGARARINAWPLETADTSAVAEPPVTDGATGDVTMKFVRLAY